MRLELSSGTPADWLRRARSNLIRARQPPSPGVLWEDLCFDAQQAAEKAIKGLLVFYGIPFRFVHDIAELLTCLQARGVALPDEIRAAAMLSDYAVAARYPGPMEPVTEEEYQEAILIAEQVVSWVERLIQAASPNDCYEGSER